MRLKLLSMLIVVIVVCVTLPMGVAAQEDGDEEVTLTVSVVDPDGELIGGAPVEATWDDGNETAAGTTASNGRVFIDVPRGVDVELDIGDNDRFVRNQPLVVEDADESEVELEVFLQGVATVTVVDSAGEALPDATVTLTEDRRTVSSGETDDDGVFESDPVERGEYRISAVKPGFFENGSDLTVEAETETEIALEEGRVTLDIEVVDDHFDPPRTLSDGRIRIDAEVFDADVSASGGSASLNVPVNARYTIVAVKEGYDGTQRHLNVREEPRSVTVTAQRNPELTLSAANTRVIVGESTRLEVRNAYDEPAAGVDVRMDGEMIGETDERGEVSVSIDTVGERTLIASDARVESDPINITGVDPDAESDSPTDEATPEDTPGFGIVAAVVAILLTFAAYAGRAD